MNALLKMSVGLLLGAALLSGAVQAQAPDRVGRIAYLAGDVQFYSESEQAWLPAQLNAPVSSRNSLFTGPNGRAEVRFGSTAVALDAQTQLDIQVLDDAGFKADVPRGSVSLRVPRIEDDESFEMTAPGASYAVLQTGRYRIDAADDTSSVTVLAGLVNASVAGDGSAMVEAGQALSVANGGFARHAARSSALDAWAAQRDNAYRASQSARYVSPNMTGYEELDTNGRWASDPDYGNVWYPTTHVSAGWAPYRDGRWAYVPPWGWTWIDAAPWGFAPFHYGRWVLIGARWAWMPGAYVRRPSYAPALVGFIGGSTASGVAISISIGTQPAVGWYPLPPWEHYRPAYHHHDRQQRNINNFNIGKPPSHAWRMVENKRVTVNQVHGATVVPREAFVDSRPVRRAAIPVSAPLLAAPQASAVPVVAPTRAPSGNGRPEFGDRRGAREPDQGRAERGRGGAEAGAGNSAPARAAESPTPPVPTGSEPRPGLWRAEGRRDDRQAPPATVVPQGRAPAVAVVPPVPAPSAPAISPEPRPEQNRGAERRSPPAIAAPQTSQPVPGPRIERLPEQPAAAPARREAEQRNSAPVTESAPRTPAAAPEVPAPRMRAEPPAVRQEPRVEPRIEQRQERQEQRSPAPTLETVRRPPPAAAEVAAPRIRAEPPVVRQEPRAEPPAAPRIEPRHEQRPMQRVEPPPQVRAPPPQPQAQPEQRRAPEPERERRPHGERDKDRQ